MHFAEAGASDGAQLAVLLPGEQVPFSGVPEFVVEPPHEYLCVSGHGQQTVLIRHGSERLVLDPDQTRHSLAMVVLIYRRVTQEGITFTFF